MSHFLVSHRVPHIPAVVGNEAVTGMATILGYALGSTIGQGLDTQLTVLTGAGVDEDRVYTDKPSGAAAASGSANPLAGQRGPAAVRGRGIGARSQRVPPGRIPERLIGIRQ